MWNKGNDNKTKWTRMVVVKDLGNEEIHGTFWGRFWKVPLYNFSAKQLKVYIAARLASIKFRMKDIKPLFK